MFKLTQKTFKVKNLADYVEPLKLTLIELTLTIAIARVLYEVQLARVLGTHPCGVLWEKMAKSVHAYGQPYPHEQVGRILIGFGIMALTLKASEQGLAKIQQAREERGWTQEDPRWLVEISKILDPNTNWQPGCDGLQPPKGCTLATWKRFLNGKEAIRANTYKAFCQVLGLNWKDTISSVERQLPTVNQGVDWGTAPHTPVFYGRSTELALLEQWILDDGCRLVGLLGLGGIGTTTLAIWVAKQLQDQFDYVVWRSLRHAPPVEETIANLLQVLSRQPMAEVGSADLLGQLIERLRDRRCLLILDDVQTVLGSGKLAGTYQPGYEGYGELFSRIAHSHHHSCLLLTSWEKPKEIAIAEGPNQPVRSLTLEGLGAAAREILREKGLPEEELWEELIRPYRGNALALKIVATTIRDVFGGSVSEFLAKNTLFLGDFEYLLYDQLNRCSALEKEIMRLLAGEPQLLTIAKLHQAIAQPISQSEVIKGVESLVRRSLVEVQKDGENGNTVYALQPAIKKYVSTKWSGD
jgi:hypothetical protein